MFFFPHLSKDKLVKYQGITKSPQPVAGQEVGSELLDKVVMQREEKQEREQAVITVE